MARFGDVHDACTASDREDVNLLKRCNFFKQERFQPTYCIFQRLDPGPMEVEMDLMKTASIVVEGDCVTVDVPQMDTDEQHCVIVLSKT